MEKWNFYFLTFVFLLKFFYCYYLNYIIIIIFLKILYSCKLSSLYRYFYQLSWFFVLCSFQSICFRSSFLFFYCPRVSGPVYFCIFIIYFLLMKRTFVLRHVCNIVPKVISSTIRTTNFFPIQRQVQHNNIAFILLKIT